MLISVLCFLASLGHSQDLPPISAATDYARLREGINPPKLLHSSDPEYTSQALEAGIEGTLVLHAIVDVKGNVAYATVLSPLPAGLDAKAMAAVRHWRYAPADMDGEIIPVLTTIDVLFRLPYKPPDPAAEQRRKAFQRIANRISAADPTPTPDEVRELKDLARHGLMPAVGLLGQLDFLGLGVPKNITEGLADLQKAAGQHDTRSLFFLGSTEIAGRLLPKNEAQGWQFVQQAAFLGSADAQSALGDKDERANDRSEAKRYYRMCAATGHAVCEFRLGRMLVTGPDMNPDDFAQGVGWLELAKDRGDRDAARLWETAVAKLSSIQLDWVKQLKPHLELRDYRGF